MKQVVIGLSGHIDHGKTTLVHALTGVNTDSLSEEQKRGMTIDLGFAFLNKEITLIDVPGHEKFVKNMMAGVSGIDIALLVVAADDGVMPQTKEHFEILNLLDISTGIIALNKVDIADDELIDIVELEIAELVNGTFMENAPIIRVSAIKKEGIDDLKNSIINLSQSVSTREDRGIFRMHVDRAFSMKGHGTIATGTVHSGEIKINDSVEILPSNQKSRIRSLQSHGQIVQSVSIGDRAAINLHGINLTQIQRGDQLANPGYLLSVNQVGVRINILRSAIKAISQNQRIRIHLGTQEVMARIALTSGKLVNPGESTAALLKLESKLVIARGDKFIIRSYSPIATIGGGEVLDVNIEQKWVEVKKKIQSLYEKSEKNQIIQLIEQEGLSPITFKNLKFRLTISEQKIDEMVKNNEELNWKKYKQNKWLVTNRQWKNIKKKILNFIKQYHSDNAMERGVQREEIRQKLKMEAAILEISLIEMETDKIIVQKEELWADSNFKVQLDSNDTSLQINVLKILDQEGFTSSNINELSDRIGEPTSKIIQVLKIAELQGKLLRINGNLIFTQKNFLLLKEKVNSFFRHNIEMSIPDFKELAQTSRKYAVPLLEYFDKLKITYRDGNSRKLVK